MQPGGGPGDRLILVMRIIQLMVSRDWGGVERYILDVSTAMRAKGHDVSIIARDYPEVTHRFIDSGFKVVTAPLSKSLDFISPRRLALMANGDEPVIIHVHTFREAVNAILAKKNISKQECPYRDNATYCKVGEQFPA